MERQRLIIKPIQPNSALLMSRRRAIWFSGCRRRCKGSNPKRVCQTGGKTARFLRRRQARASTLFNARAAPVIQYHPFLLRQPESVLMKPPFSLLLASLSQRLAIAAAVLLIVWCVYYWAVSA